MSAVKEKAKGETASRTRLRLWLKLLKTTNAIEDELRRRSERSRAPQVSGPLTW